MIIVKFENSTGKEVPELVEGYDANVPPLSARGCTFGTQRGLREKRN